MNKNYIFISGAPRSGTSALTNALSNCDNTKIGMEFFIDAIQLKDPKQLTPASFEPDALRASLSKKFSGDVLEAHLAEFAASNVIGDKHPHYHRQLGRLNQEFPRCRHLFIFRTLQDVANSFQQRCDNPDDEGWKLADYKAIEYWCQGAANILDLHEKAPMKCMILNFRHFFASGKTEGKAAFAALHAELSRSYDMGDMDQGRLDRLLDLSADKQEENGWSDAEETDLDAVARLFEKYTENQRSAKWTSEAFLKLVTDLRAAVWTP